MAPRYPVITQNSNKALNELKKLEGFGEELEYLIGAGSAADGISAGDVANYLKQLGTKTSLHDTNIATINSDLETRASALTLSTKMKSGLDNVLPVNLVKELEGPEASSKFGYTVHFYNDGDGLVIGAPETTGSSSNGKLYTYEKNSGNWFKTATVEGTTAGFGRYVSITDDGTRVLQCSEDYTPYGSTYLKQPAPAENHAVFTVPDDYTAVDGPMNDPYYGQPIQVITGIDGTYYSNGTYELTSVPGVTKTGSWFNGGSGYIDGFAVGANFVSGLQYLVTNFGSLVSVTVGHVVNGTISSITITGVDTFQSGQAAYYNAIYKFELELVLPRGQPGVAAIEPPPDTFVLQATIDEAYRGKISGDGSTIAVFLKKGAGVYDFTLFDVANLPTDASAAASGTLKHTVNTGGFYPVAITTDGSRIVASGGNNVLPKMFIRQVDGSYTDTAFSSSMAVPTYIHNIEITGDGTVVVIGDSGNQTVSYLQKNTANNDYDFKTSVTGETSGHRFGGGHSGTSVSPNGLIVAIGDDWFSVAGSQKHGNAYLYKYENSILSRVTSFGMGDLAADSRLGHSIDITNDSVAVTTLNIPTTDDTLSGKVDIYTMLPISDNFGISQLYSSIAQIEAKLSDSLLPQDLSSYPSLTNFTASTPASGYLPLRNTGNIQVDGLVSVFTDGLSDKWTAEFVNATLSNGVVSNIDNILSCTESFNNNSIHHLMTSKQYSQFTLTCEFQVAAADKSVASVLWDLQPVASANEGGASYTYRAVDLTGQIRSSTDTFSTSNVIGTGWKTLKVSKLNTTVNVEIDEGTPIIDTTSNDTGYIGILANSNIQYRNIRIHSNTVSS